VHTPRRDDYESTEQYLEALDLEAAVRRDEQLTTAEREAAHQVFAEHFGTCWRPEWVVRP
jgi:hypothetical protein